MMRNFNTTKKQPPGLPNWFALLRRSDALPALSDALPALSDALPALSALPLRLSRSKAKRSNTSAKSLLGVTIKNTQTERNLVSRDS